MTGAFGDKSFASRAEETGRSIVSCGEGEGAGGGLGLCSPFLSGL